MSAALRSTEITTTVDSDLAGSVPAVLHSIEAAEKRLEELYSYCDRLHRANIEHDAHSCVLCFETR